MPTIWAFFSLWTHYHPQCTGILSADCNPLERLGAGGGERTFSRLLTQFALSLQKQTSSPALSFVGRHCGASHAKTHCGCKAQISVKKGEATIYVYAQNGSFTTVKATVK